MQSLNHLNINPDEDISPFIRGKIHIIQKKDGYRFNVDSILLVSFVNISSSKKVIDLGTGSGVIPILLNLKFKNLKLYAIEVQESMYSLAERNFKLNNVEVDLKLVDVRDIKTVFQNQFFDCVITNPPYFISKDYSSNQYVEKSEHLATFEDFVKSASYLLKNKGKFYYIFPVSRFVESITICKSYKLQPKRFRFIYPSVNENATHVLVECLKGGKERGEVVEKPLIMYENPKEKKYTQEVWNLLENFI